MTASPRAWLMAASGGDMRYGLSFATAIMLSSASPALAAVTTFTVAGTFQDGTVLSGSFLYDDAEGPYFGFRNVDTSLNGTAFKSAIGAGQISAVQPVFQVDFGGGMGSSRMELLFTTAVENDPSSIDSRELSALSRIIGPRGGLTFLGNGGTITAVTSAVPEPTVWAMMLTGFGLIGSVLRRRKMTAVAA